jgi:hypothetical protein
VRWQLQNNASEEWGVQTPPARRRGPRRRARTRRRWSPPPPCTCSTPRPNPSPRRTRTGTPRCSATSCEFVKANVEKPVLHICWLFSCLLLASFVRFVISHTTHTHTHTGLHLHQDITVRVRKGCETRRFRATGHNWIRRVQPPALLRGMRGLIFAAEISAITVYSEKVEQPAT